MSCGSGEPPTRKVSTGMSDSQRLTFTTVNISAPDPGALARFYKRPLGWEIAAEEPDWVVLRAPDGGVGLAFQTESPYARPTWPAGPTDQQMMMHLE
jgi:hypothetical protein